MSRFQTIGNVSVAIAAALFVLPLNYLLWYYARKHLSDYQWVTPTLVVLIPMWLLLMTALLSVAASNGFDWLPLGRSAHYAFIVSATIALAVVSFALVGSYIRPGLTPSFLYYPPLALVVVGTMVMVILSLNPQLGVSARVIRMPWTIVTALSLVACVGFGGYWLATTGVSSITEMAVRRLTMPSAQEVLPKISALDPQRDFTDLLGFTSRHATTEIRETATARLRSNPKFLDNLANELENGNSQNAIEFIHSATLTPAEQERLAGPTRKAMQRFVDGIPAANYTTGKHLRELRSWGKEMFRVLPEKFVTTRVDFAPVIADFNDK